MRKYITLKKHVLILLSFIGLLASCSNNEETDSGTLFVNNARVVEEGKTLSPGDIVHLEGDGYLATDDVTLDFFWETGEELFPEGYIKVYHAKVLSQSPKGMTVQMPYRKPASRVEINLCREGRYMKIGTVNLTDGTTPKTLYLYGINNSSELASSQEYAMTRWLDNDCNTTEMKTWGLNAHPDFHSAVGMYRAYGICGLAKENGKQHPFFFDLLTQQWEKLSDVPAIALVSHPSYIAALQSYDGKNYCLRIISSDLETSYDVKTAKARSTSPPPNMPLPNGLEAEHFGEYPGVYHSRYMLFSANKGNGKWTPVVFDIQIGFRVLEDIEAEALIPFSFFKKDVNNANSSAWISGYIVVRKEPDEGYNSLFYTFDGNATFTNEPLTEHPYKALSATANNDRSGTLTVHFKTPNSGNVTSELSLEGKKWTDIATSCTFDEIVWIN